MAESNNVTNTDTILREGLADIRKHIEKLHLPNAAYAAIGIADNEHIIAIIDGDTAVTMKTTSKTNDTHTEVITWLNKYAQDNNVKIIAAAILAASREVDQFCSRLWLDEDIVPYHITHRKKIDEAIVQEEAREICTKFDANNLVKVPLTDTNEVVVDFLVTKDEYKKTVKEDVWDYLEKEVERFGKNNNDLVFFNATPQGGGVALMRHALIRLYNLFDIDAHWHVLQPNKDVFEITKTKFHNILQAVAPGDVELTEHDKQLYNSWNKDNADLFEDVIKRAKVIVIDDPQPSGMIPHITDMNPKAEIIYRSHIHLDKELLAKPNVPQYTTWQFIWHNAHAAESFISHPVEEFIPRDVFEKTLTMPATTDPLDGLNKPLNEQQMKYYMGLFNKILFEHDQEPLDPTRPYAIQIARFDPSKGIPDVIESYRQLREMLGPDDIVPQLVIVGHGSIDDPDGVPIYNMIIHLLQSAQYKHLADDVKVVRLHHNDQILNALMRGSKVALQLSHKEGFEVKVSEAIHKGKPVIASRTGGIPLQIEDGKTGFLVDVGNCGEVANHLHKLFTDETLYDTMSRRAQDTLNPNYFTVYNALKWLFLANTLLEEHELPGQARSVKSLIGKPLT